MNLRYIMLSEEKSDPKIHPLYDATFGNGTTIGRKEKNGSMVAKGQRG